MREHEMDTRGEKKLCGAPFILEQVKSLSTSVIPLME